MKCFIVRFNDHNKILAEKLGINFYCGVVKKWLVIDENQKKKLDYNNIIYEIKEEFIKNNHNEVKHIQRQPLEDGFNIDGSQKGNYSLSEMEIKLDELYTKYGPDGTHNPNIIQERFIAGISIEQRSILMFRLGKNIDNPAVFYCACTHAREPVAMMSLLHLMFWLGENYKENPLTIDERRAKSLIDNHTLWIMPLNNPDGYDYNEEIQPSGGGLQRKNRRPGTCSGQTSNGIDLNRNYAYDWGINNTGSSGNSCSQVYRGPLAFSEPESRIKRDFIGHTNNIITNMKNIKISLHTHTYGNLLIYPNELPSEYKNIYTTLGLEMSKYNNYLVGDDLETVGYQVNGDEVSWCNNGTMGDFIYSFTPEIGASTDGFWPDESRIPILINDSLYMYLSGVSLTSGHPVIVDITSNTDIIPNTTVTLNLTIKNKGLDNCSNIKIELNGIQYNLDTSIDPNEEQIVELEVIIPSDSIPNSQLSLYSFDINNFPIQSEKNLTVVLEVTDLLIELVKGWNLIGSGTSENMIIDDPNNIVIPNSVYSYDSTLGYQNTTNLKISKGYWIKTNNAGSIILKPL